ncbi:hypothetical protein [[Leptolyngbya] sp. PCC 7376]|nr:hypothetical protein [[Leptolyngbya] sp. PCC 7376]
MTLVLCYNICKQAIAVRRSQTMRHRHSIRSATEEQPNDHRK